MSSSIKALKNRIVLRNSFVEIEISTKDAEVLGIKRLDTNESVMDSKEKTCFFTVYKESDEESVEEYDLDDKITNKDEPVEIKKLTLDGDVISIITEYQTLRVKVGVFDNYFTYEIVDDMQEPLERIEFADMKLDFEGDFAAAAISMTVNGVVPRIPRNTERRIRGVVRRTSGNSKGAKVGEVMSPFSLQRDILKELCSTIDPEKGIVLRTSGPWTKDYLPNYENYMIILGFKPELVERADEYKAMGVDQYDFHQGEWAFWQGNFKCTKLRDMTEFREKFSDPLKEKGISCAIHTYAHYIHKSCVEYLADPKWQKDLLTGEVYTLSEDISAEDDIINVLEDISGLSTDYSFFSQSLPYIIIGNEIISYVKDHGRFESCARGVCGTKAVAHKKGEKVIHLKGKFNLFSPIPGSELFLEIARNTAKAYNEGGFKMIYLDALDGLYSLPIDQHYYSAQFVHEIIKHCNTEPTIEYAAPCGSVWCAMGRTGAWDAPYKGYRGFNKYHVVMNHKDGDFCHLLGMMGWYGLYPQSDGYPVGQPGNYNTKYHHWDETEFLGSLCLIHGYSMVFRNGLPSGRTPALDRNIRIFKKYHDVKMSRYFSDEYLEKLKDPDREYFLKEKRGGKWTFEEKAFPFKRYFDIADKSRAVEEFVNPFGAQTPFVRLEAGLSTLKENGMLLLPLDENKQISTEPYTYTFASPIDCTNNNAIVFRIKGNGKKGSAVRVTFGCKKARGGAAYIVDTDFEGWREYTFLESDNGERPDLPFDSRDGHFYNVYLHGIKLEAMSHIKIDTACDVEGVRMGSIYGYRMSYEVTKNPKIKVGNTEVMFECELQSTDFIEFDGEKAEVIDRYGNSKPVYFEGGIKVPKGKFKAEISSSAALNGGVQNFKLTFGLTGREIK